MNNLELTLIGLQTLVSQHVQKTDIDLAKATLYAFDYDINGHSSNRVVEIVNKYGFEYKIVEFEDYDTIHIFVK